MTKQTEALKLALEALEELNNTSSYWWHEVDEATVAKLDSAFTAIKETLAQPEQEPWPEEPFGHMAGGVQPPQRPWVGLTNDEVNNFAAGCHLGKSVQGAIYEAEAKLKEKNNAA